MNWLDIVVILVIAGFTLAAYSAGLIRELITFAAVLAGVVVAGLLYERLAKDVLVFIDDEDAAEAVAFLALFGSVYLLGQIGAYMLKTGAALLMLGPYDHLGGAIFGFFKGVLVVQILLIVFAAYPSLELDAAVDNSEFARYFVDDLSFVLNILPGEFDQRIDQFLDPQQSAAGVRDVPTGSAGDRG
jgi:membrane protein required for colicin V production